MKKPIIILSLLISSFSFLAQDIDLDSKFIRNTIASPDGGFFILNTDEDYPLKFWLRADGQVNWYLDGQDMFIRDGSFEAFPVEEPGIFYNYDFMHIDGGNGRIGFNLLDGKSDGQGGVTDLPLTSSIHLMGSIATRVRIMDGTGGYTIKQDDHILIIILGDDNASLFLPSADSCKGRSYLFKRDDGSGNNRDAIIVAQPGESIDGGSEYEISKTLGVVELVCDGIQWWVVSQEDQLASDVVSGDSTLNKSNDVVGVIFSQDNEDITITLPPAATYPDKRYEIKRNADGATPTGCTLYVVPSDAEMLDQYNATDNIYTMSKDWEAITVQSTGTRWLILSNYGH